MTDLDLIQTAEYIGIKKSFLERIIKNGKELHYFKSGRKHMIKQEEIDVWKRMKEQRKVNLDKSDFIRALKFAIEINYSGHTRSDFGGKRQRSVTQAVENWTQGALAEIALTKFIEQKYAVKLGLEFRVFKDQIVGQDIVSVTKKKVSNPPRKGVSVKSGKENGMVLIVPVAEVERSSRVSDFYVFVRIIYPNDFILRLLRDHPDISDIKNLIPELTSFYGEIAGYCLKEELEKRIVPEADIDKERYVSVTGNLKNTDADWQLFVDQL